jgi:hypothetical protein
MLSAVGRQDTTSTLRLVFTEVVLVRLYHAFVVGALFFRPVLDAEVLCWRYDLVRVR